MTENAPCPKCQNEGPHPIDGKNLRCANPDCHTLFPNPFMEPAHA